MTDAATLRPGDPQMLTWRPADSALESRNAGASGIVLCTVLAVLSLLLGAGGAVGHVQALRLIGAFGVVIFGLGAAPLALARDIELLPRLTAASLIGLAVLLGVGTLMTDVRVLWHPVLAAVLFLAAAGGLHVVGLSRALKSGAPDRTSFNSAIRATKLTLFRYPIPILATVVGTGLWLISALSLHDPNPGVGGFLTKISPAWYVGNVLIVLGFVLGRGHDRLAGPAVMSLVISTTLTPALVYAAPNEPSAAKHVHLVQIILTHHHLDPSAGIYQAYSAFFAGIAWLCRIVAVHDPFGLATYWPVLAGMICVIELRLLMGQMVESTARRWIAVTLVMLVNTVGQTYFSPQSFSFVMAIGIIAILQPRPGERPLGKHSTTAILILVSVVLAVTHELTPYILAATLGVLAIFRLARVWEPFVMGVPAICWAAIQHSVVAGNFSFSQMFNFGNLHPPIVLATPGLKRMPIVGLSSDALLVGLLILIGLAARGSLSNVRRGSTWAYGMAALTGLLIVMINPYGNEGIFRASLFAIPWLAVLAVRPKLPTGALQKHSGSRVGRAVARARGLDALVRGRARLGRWRGVLQAGALTTLLITLFATFCLSADGMDGSLVVRQSEVSAVQFFVRTAPAHSALLQMSIGDSPATQPQFDSKLAILNWSNVAPLALVSIRHPVQADVAYLEAEYQTWARYSGVHIASHMYLFWTEGLALYQAEYGLQSRATADQWLAVLKKSNRVSLVFHQGVTYLFRFK
jgi:hypothetical protein